MPENRTFKTVLTCDECGKKFDGFYSEDETEYDAACDASCPDCGNVHCPQCAKFHDCIRHDEEDFPDDFDEMDYDQEDEEDVTETLPS